MADQLNLCVAVKPYSRVFKGGVSVRSPTFYNFRQCTGFLVPHLRRGKRGLPDPEWKCSICHTTEAKTEVNKVLSRIAQDYSMTDKQNTTSCEVFLQHYGHNKLLHHNHYFITDVRLKLAQLYGQTTENDVESLSDATLAQKIKLCRQSLDFASALYPGMSFRCNSDYGRWNLLQAHIYM